MTIFSTLLYKTIFQVGEQEVIKSF